LKAVFPLKSLTICQLYLIIQPLFVNLDNQEIGSTMSPYWIILAVIITMVIVSFVQNKLWTSYMYDLTLEWREAGQHRYVRGYERVAEVVAEIDHTLLKNSAALHLMHYATIDDEGGPSDWAVISDYRFLHNGPDLRDASKWIRDNKPGETVKVRVYYKGQPSYLIGIESMDHWRDQAFLVVNKTQLALYRHWSRNEYLLIWMRDDKKYHTIGNETHILTRQQAAIRGAFEEHAPLGPLWHETAA
jgi:hypothetical protein